MMDVMLLKNPTMNDSRALLNTMHVARESLKIKKVYWVDRKCCRGTSPEWVKGSK